jgi:hypothetical protein
MKMENNQIMIIDKEETQTKSPTAQQPRTRSEKPKSIPIRVISESYHLLPPYNEDNND